MWIWCIDEEDDYECASVLSSHTQDVKCVSWHPTKDELVSGSYDNTIKVYKELEDDWECTCTLGIHSALSTLPVLSTCPLYFTLSACPLCSVRSTCPLCLSTLPVHSTVRATYVLKGLNCYYNASENKDAVQLQSVPFGCV